MSSALSTNPVHADPRLRVVLHTNIYIAAFNHLRGRNAQLWSACQIAPALRDCQRNRQNSIREQGHDLILKPGFKAGALVTDRQVGVRKGRSYRPDSYSQTKVPTEVARTLY